MKQASAKQRFGWLVATILGMTLPWSSAAQSPVLSAKAGGQRKALVMGYGGPNSSHAEAAKVCFLGSVGNPANDPKKGWTCEFTWDVMRRLGMNPQTTGEEAFFAEIDRRQLGYRIAISCGPFSSTLKCWGAALDHGIMPFGAQGNNNRGQRMPDEIGLHGGVGVAGGSYANVTSYGPAVEFIDTIARGIAHPDYEEAVQSYANQRVAARFAKVLDAHPEYNIWDARQHLRQSATYWASGWTELNGYGRAGEDVAVGALLPAPPVEFEISKSRDHHRVSFSWRNFPQTGFAGTVIARAGGQILYDGMGTNFVWASTVDGDETFIYWSKNRSGEKSRIETYQRRIITGLSQGAYRSCAIFGAPAGEEAKNALMCNLFSHIAKGWNCDELYKTGNAYYDQVQRFPLGVVAGVFPSFSGMTTFVLTNHYRIVLAPVTQEEGDLFRHKADWDRLVHAGVAVVLPHHAGNSISRKPQARRLSPPRLFSAITVGYGITNNYRSFGPGLEFFDASDLPGTTLGLPNQTDAAATVAGKLARLLEANPNYNFWDARQHLRQNSSGYVAGWREDGGYGRPLLEPLTRSELDPGPPVDIQVRWSTDGKGTEFSWMNFRQSSFAQTIIQAGDGREIYAGTETHFVWSGESTGPFRFFSRDKAGRLSRSEIYTVIEASVK
jgi:hypothetical protein